MSGPSRKSCIDLLEAELGTKSGNEDDAYGNSNGSQKTKSKQFKDAFSWLEPEDKLRSLLQRYMGFE